MHLAMGAVRPYVFKRDQGVCGECGLDTEEVRRYLDTLHELHWKQWQQHLADWEIPAGRENLWDADHIRPWSEGGAELGLENLRTLCLWCHKARTRRWHRERAEARRGQLALQVDNL
jgi:5-methylcytosine-specific restriction protein A